MVGLNEGTQTSANNQEKLRRQIIVENGIRMWKERQELARQKKLREQAEVREILDKFWPWGQKAKPRGLRNLRLEGIFPNGDYLKANRFVGVLELGKPGCGAPIISSFGQKLTKTREDPILRFQTCGNLKRYVDNTLRYKTSKNQQNEYKKELDKLLEEKRLIQKREKEADLENERMQFLRSPPWGKPGPGGHPWRHPRAIGLNFFKSLGWTNEKTMQMLDEQSTKYKETNRKEFNKFKNMRMVKPNQIIKQDVVVYPKQINSVSINGNPNGELVSLLVKHKVEPQKKTLPSTDVTRSIDPETISKMKFEGCRYLQELSLQINRKDSEVKQQKAIEKETTARHFSTWSTFWGRPGHGAPLPVIKRKQLDRLLYQPNMLTPISVA